MTPEDRQRRRDEREERAAVEAALIEQGVRENKSYAEIGLMFDPPRSTTWVFKRACRFLAINDQGEQVPIVDLHTRRGKRGIPYSRRERPASTGTTLAGLPHKPFERVA